MQESETADAVYVRPHLQVCVQQRPTDEPVCRAASVQPRAHPLLRGARDVWVWEVSGSDADQPDSEPTPVQRADLHVRLRLAYYY